MPESFTCPECDTEVELNIIDWGNRGTSPRNWDPGDPGEAPEWAWPDAARPGCPSEDCSFRPGDASWGTEITTEWRGVRQESGVSRFEQYVEQQVGRLQEEHWERLAEDAAERRAEDREDRDWDRGEARRWGGKDD